MKTVFFKICIGALLFSSFLFSAGCGGKDTHETVPSVLESEEFFYSQLTEENVLEENDTAEILTEQAAEAAGVMQKSEDKQYLVDLYNRSVDSHNLKRTSMKQETLRGGINLGGQEIDLSEDKNKGLREQTQTTDNSQSPCSLQKLSVDNVETAEKINNKIVFRLKNYSSGIDISQGAGDYHGIVEKERTEEILNNAVKYLKLPGTVNVASGEYRLSDGIITAYFSPDFSTLEKVTFSGTEKISGKVEYLIMNVQINIEFSLNSMYQR